MASKCFHSGPSLSSLQQQLAVSMVSSSPRVAPESGFLVSQVGILPDNAPLITRSPMSPRNHQMSSPNVFTSPSSAVSSSESSSRQSSAGQNPQAKSPLVYGQILAKALSQKSPCQEQITRTVYVTDTRVLAQTPSPARSQPQSGDAPPSFLHTVSTEPRVFHQEPKSIAAHPVAVHPPSPHKGYVSLTAQDGALASDLSSPSSRGCLSSPNHFLSPSPMGEFVDSPASVCLPGSPDTTDQGTADADSGYSDNLTDKSTSPDKQPGKGEESQTSPVKRKRVRKSRAKLQDPEQKVIIKKTRRVRANDRERTRMHGLNDAMDELRKHLPNDGNAGKLTKIDTLRTASNYIKVLKMMLTEMEKGEDLTSSTSPTSAAWPSDLLATTNSLYIQPAASPDSSSGMTSPPAHAAAVYGDGRLQTCGMVSPERGLVGSGQFQSAAFPSCGLPDSYGVPGASASMASSLSGFLDSCSSTVSTLDNGRAFGTQPVNGGAISAGFTTSGFESTAVNTVFGQQYSLNGPFSSAQTMLQQSSQCY